MVTTRNPRSVGKLATVFEELDHSRDVGLHAKSEPMSPEKLDVVKAMSADLVTAALRFANLYKFELAEVLLDRVEEKNKTVLPAWRSFT